MKTLNINPILENMHVLVRSHEIETGAYARWTLNGHNSVNPYGCADAANILYTLNRFPREPEIREKWISTLQSLQDSETGLYQDGSHLPIHTTAHCLAALELFDAGPLHPIRDWEIYRDPQELRALLDSLDWDHEKGCGHIGAAVYAIFALYDLSRGCALPEDWKKAYFAWFDEHCDPQTGVWHKDHLTNDVSMSLRMGGAFHYYFNYSHAHQPFPYPDALIDCCLDRCTTEEGHANHPNFGRQFHFIEIDWVYCLNRASRQTSHRFEEIKETLYRFAVDYIDYLNHVDWKTDRGADDLHLLFGTLCCLAELQDALPGVISSAEPLRLVLNRRPFI